MDDVRALVARYRAADKATRQYYALFKRVRPHLGMIDIHDQLGAQVVAFYSQSAHEYPGELRHGDVICRK